MRMGISAIRVLPIVQYEAKKTPLLGSCEHSEHTGEAIPQAEEAKIWPSGAHVADQIASPVCQPVLQPWWNHLRLDVEFILMLILPILLRRTPA
jgi:hypothetical protein